MSGSRQQAAPSFNDSPQNALRTRQLAKPENPVSPELIAIITASVAIIGFLWNLHRDVADLRERMARLEGLFEGFTRRDPPAA